MITSFFVRVSAFASTVTALLFAATSALAAFPELRLVPVSSGQMIAPVEFAHPGDGSGRLFIADQLGTIRILNTATDTLLSTPFLNLSGKLVSITTSYDERGLLGLAFHPNFQVNRKFYVYYSAPSPDQPGTASAPVDHRSVVAEYTVSTTTPNMANAGSERILLTFNQPQSNHNGGDLCFGPDGMLYISTGDGGSANDNNAGHTGGSSSRPANALGNAQDLTNLLGKILRIDPLGTNGPGGQYGIPADNPFVGQGGGVRQEIYAYGLRNPWRMSFDPPSGRCYAGDVGQGKVEEINLITAGGNYGWRNREGSFDFAPSAPGTGPFIDPIAQYAHPGQVIGDPELPQFGTSVTGGEVYRGSRIQGLGGKYVFADWSADFTRPGGTLLGLEETAPNSNSFSLSKLTIVGGNPIAFFITAIGSDQSGELYVATRTRSGPETGANGLPTGTIFRLSPSVQQSQVTLTADRDTSLFDGENGNSSGAGVTLFSGVTGGKAAFALRHALIRFDLSPIPAGALIASAEVNLNVSFAAFNTGNFALHRLTSDWGESTSDSGPLGGVGVEAANGDATWSHAFFPSTPWTSPGGDYAATASASLTPVVIGQNSWTSEQLGQDVQDWVNGTRPNYGWLLRDLGTLPSAKRIDSREATDAAVRPDLVVTYGEGPKTPVLLGLALGSDSGSSATDGITNVSTPVIRGYASLGATVRVLVNSTEVASEIVSTLPFSITLPTLEDGVKTITATAEENGHTSTASNAISVTIDTVKPDAPSGLDLLPVRDTGNSNTDNVTSSPRLQISGNAPTGTTVTLFTRLTPFQLGPIGSTEGGSPWTITTSDLDSRIHQLTATATDVAGNVSDEAEVLEVEIKDARAATPVSVPTSPADLASKTATAVRWSDHIATAAGLYDGLLRDAADAETVIGAASSFQLASTGVLSGVVQLNGRALRIRATISSEGAVKATVTVPRSTPVDLDLQLTQTSNGYGLLGTIGWGVFSTVGDIPQAPYHRTNRPLAAPASGLYTMLIPSQSDWPSDAPQGDGWARVSISTGGAVSVTGVTGDGTSFTEKAFVSGDSEINLFTDLYPVTLDGKRGWLGGRVVLRSLSGSDFDGKLTWRKFADPRQPRYKDEINLNPWAIGSLYTKPIASQPSMLNVVPEEYNAEFTFIGDAPPGNGEFSLARAITWKQNNTFVHYGPQTLGGSGKAADGGVRVEFSDRATREAFKFSGVVFQAQNIVAGTFVNGAASGAFRIRPDTNVGYPGREPAGSLTEVLAQTSPATPPDESEPDFEAAAVGTYDGVLTLGGATSGGLQNLVLTTRRTFTGTLWIESTRYNLRQTLSTGGDVTFSISRRSPASPIIVELRLTKMNDTSDGFGFTGTVTIDSTVHTIDAQKLPTFTKRNPAPETGGYTLAMREPEGNTPETQPGGDGYGVLGVRYDGRCSGAFTLPDGTSVSLAGRVARRSNDGNTNPPSWTTEWSFYRGLYGRSPKGFLAGKLTFRTPNTISDLDGDWRWVKLAGATAVSGYPTITENRKVVGSRYQIPNGTRAIDGLAADDFNVWLRFLGPDLSMDPTITMNSLDRAATWSLANRVIYYGPERVKLRFNPRNGLLTGTFADAPYGVSTSFGGVLLQNQDRVTGSYRAQGLSGLFFVQPR